MFTKTWAYFFGCMYESKTLLWIDVPAELAIVTAVMDADSQSVIVHGHVTWQIPDRSKNDTLFSCNDWHILKSKLIPFNLERSRYEPIGQLHMFVTHARVENGWCYNIGNGHIDLIL